MSSDIATDKTMPESPRLSVSPVALPPVAAPMAAPMALPPVAAPMAAPVAPPASASGPSSRSVVINAGSTEEDVSMISGIHWIFNAPEDIVGTAAPFDAEQFKSHRSGEYFAYRIPGFQPGEEAEITLGFAENWLANCRDTRNRNMNVAVNQQPFIQGLNIYAEAGCFGVLKKFGVFNADANGNFIIEFTSNNPNQNPLVSVIAVDPVGGGQQEEKPSSAIGSFTLVSAADRGDIMVLEDGAVIDLDELATSELSIRVDTTGDSVKWVRFQYDNLSQSEGNAPYAMDGKKGGCCFNAVPYLASPGKKTIVVDAFGAGGMLGSATLTFTVLGVGSDMYGEEGYTLEDSLFPMPDFFLDVGSANETDDLVQGQFYRKYASIASIENVPSIYEETMFQTHRSGNSPFTYTIGGFMAYQQAEITLGFAETWRPNCNNNKRLMDISVNGAIFAQNFDVFALAGGCSKALLITREFGADASGVFTIVFSSTVQNPMVSIISIDVVDDANELPAKAPTPGPVEAPTAPAEGPAEGPTMPTRGRVAGLTLAKPAGRAPIQALENGAVIDLAIVGSELSIVAETEGEVSHVRFKYNRDVVVEGAFPYSMGGKDTTCCYSAVSYLAYPGEKTVEVDTFYSTVRASQLTVTFTVIDSSVEGNTFSEEAYIADEATPVFDVLIDAGSDSDTDDIVTSTDTRKFFFNETIEDVPAYFEEIMFQTHRAGSSPLAYTLSGYEAGSWARVTLGFAETYNPNCGDGKRVLNITVNGEEFASSLDVFAVVGCSTALKMSNTYQADASGSFVIELVATVQNPMVSIVGIETIDIIPTDSPSSVPSDVPSSVPSDVPSLSPSEAPTSIDYGDVITGLFLVNASDRTEIRELLDGDWYDLTETGSSLSIRADTVGPVEWLRFEWLDSVHSEGSAPFAMGGKNGAYAYNPVAFLSEPTSEVQKTLKVDAFAENKVRIDRLIIEFGVTGVAEDSVPEEQDGLFFSESVVEYDIPAVFLDAGSESDTIANISGTKFWESYFPQNITGVPSPYDPETFKTHRSGSDFTYTIPGFLPGDEADITLGFAENYEANCYNGKRQFSVSVNGIFWDNVDVHSSVGCNAAMTMSKSFTANENGEFVIAFTNIKNNPFVSIIEIDSLGIPVAVPPTLPGAGPIEKLVLFNATDRSEIEVLQTGSVIDLSTLGDSPELTIVAELAYAVVRVRFKWWVEEEEVKKIEGNAPYAMGGKAGRDAFNGVAYLTQPGSGKVVEVTAFGAGNAVLGMYALEFSVVAN